MPSFLRDWQKSFLPRVDPREIQILMEVSLQKPPIISWFPKGKETCAMFILKISFPDNTLTHISSWVPLSSLWFFYPLLPLYMSDSILSHPGNSSALPADPHRNSQLPLSFGLVWKHSAVSTSVRNKYGSKNTILILVRVTFGDPWRRFMSTFSHVSLQLFMLRRHAGGRC